MTESATEGGAPAQALVIVDAQTGFLEGEKAVVEAAQLTTRLGDLLAKAQAGALVIHLQNDGAAGAVDEHGQPGWQLHLAPAEEEQIIRKCRDDGFADTKLGQLLESHKVRRIVIGGLLSEMCVSATARTALARGFQVVLPHDAHGTYDVDDIPASVVARVAEHALGDGIEPEDEVTRHELGDEDRGRDPRGPGTVPVSVPPRATATGRGLAALDGGACRPEVRP